MKTRKKLIASLTLALGLSACGGGSGGTAQPSTSPKAITEVCARILCQESHDSIIQITRCGISRRCVDTHCEECQYNGHYSVDCGTLTGTVDNENLCSTSTDIAPQQTPDSADSDQDLQDDDLDEPAVEDEEATDE